MERLQKFLANCGIASRRKCEELILSGKIEVNNKVITDLSTQIDENNDEVKYNGNIVKPETEFVYYVLHKPKGYVTSSKDDRGRKTVMDLLEDNSFRVFPVGRLDYDSEGLVLLTNDGELANKLTHPSYEIEKTYIVKINGLIKESELAVLRNGVKLDGVKTKKAKLKLINFEDGISKIQVKIMEGRNRQIRRMFSEIGKEVIFLKRIAIGELSLGGLSRGKIRKLNNFEVEYLKKM